MPKLIYVPQGPYFIKSGNKAKKSLEEFMFENYFWLATERNRLNAYLRANSVKNEIHNHLLWLLDRGEDRVAKQICPYCKEKNISFFGYSFNEKKYYTCCDRWHHCIGQLLSKVDRYPLKFSSIVRFQWGSRPYISAFLKSIFFPGCENPTVEQLFEFFSAPLETGHP